MKFPAAPEDRRIEDPPGMLDSMANSRDDEHAAIR
jgi:hypothetical protein